MNGRATRAARQLLDIPAQDYKLIRPFHGVVEAWELRLHGRDGIGVLRQASWAWVGYIGECRV